MFLEKINCFSSKIFSKHDEIDYALAQEKTISLLAQKILISLGQLIVSLPAVLVLTLPCLFIPIDSLRALTAIFAFHFYNGCINLHFGVQHSFYPITNSDYLDITTSNTTHGRICSSFVKELQQKKPSN